MLGIPRLWTPPLMNGKKHENTSENDCAGRFLAALGLSFGGNKRARWLSFVREN